MRRPNYKVFIYDHSGRYYDTFKVWAVHAQKAVDKAKADLIKQNKNENFYTFVAREENQHVS